METLQEMYNDPTSLFFSPFVKDNTPKAPAKAKKPAAPATATPKAERFKSTSPVTEFFATSNNSENTENKIIPIGTMNSYFYAANMQPKATIASHSKYVETLREQYKRDGSQGILTLINQNEEAIDILQKWRLSENALLFADLAAGIYRALTCYDDYFLDFYPLIDERTGVIEKFIVYVSADQIKKCAFGVCLDEYGNLKFGTSEILKKSGILNEFTAAVEGSRNGQSTGREPALNLYDKAGNYLGFYRPIIFEGFDEKRQGYKTILDPRFFHLTVEGGKLKIGNGSLGRYIPTIGGLLSLCVIGRAYIARESKNMDLHFPGMLPNARTATRFIHTLQAGYNMQSLFGIELFPSMKEENKEKIRINKTALIDLFPTCYNYTTGYLNYKKASEQAGLVSDILYKGLEITRGFSDLIYTPGSDKILLPSIDRTCYFENQYSKAVFVKCETPEHAIEHTGKPRYLELKKQLLEEKKAEKKN